jgi:hypothetical protein
MSLYGADFWERVDYNNYAQRTLIGFHQVTRDLKEWLDAQNEHSLGPPSLRPDA